MADPLILPPQEPGRNRLAELLAMLFPPADLSAYNGWKGQGGYRPITQAIRARHQPDAQPPAVPEVPALPPGQPNPAPPPEVAADPRAAPMLDQPTPASDQAELGRSPSLEQVLTMPLPGRKPAVPPQGATMPAEQPSDQAALGRSVTTASVAEALNRAVRNGEQVGSGMTSADMAALARRYGFTGPYR